MHSHFRKFYSLDIINIHHPILHSTVALTYLIIVTSLLQFINMQFLHSASVTTINLLYNLSNTYSWSLLMTCPYHLSLLSLIFIPNHSTLTVLLMYSFLVLSFLITPIANLNIFISVASISFPFCFVTATVSSPYTIAGLTTELYTFPFTLAGNLLSQITPDTFLRPFHPACTLFLTSLSQPPLSCTIDPKYLNSFTLGTFVWSTFTVSLSFPPFMHRYLVFDLLTFIFFPMHISRILVSAPILPWSLRKSQHHQQTALSMVVLSLLHSFTCPLSLQKGMDLMLIPGAVQP